MRGRESPFLPALGGTSGFGFGGRRPLGSLRRQEQFLPAGGLLTGDRAAVETLEFGQGRVAERSRFGAGEVALAGGRTHTRFVAGRGFDAGRGNGRLLVALENLLRHAAQCVGNPVDARREWQKLFGHHARPLRTRQVGGGGNLGGLGEFL